MHLLFDYKNPLYYTAPLGFNSYKPLRLLHAIEMGVLSMFLISRIFFARKGTDSMDLDIWNFGRNI